MPTIKLIPSTYYLSSSSYLSVSNASNMYDDCDSTNYATVTNSRTSTTSYYIYIRGFDFSQIPSAAVVSNITIRVKCNHSDGYAQALYLYNGTGTSLGSSSTTLSTTVTTHTINYTGTWDTLVSAGSDLGIRINCRRSSRNTTSYVYIYGAEIEVTYTIPDPRTVTTTLTGNGSIEPSGTQTYYDGDEYDLVVTPISASDEVTATRDGSAITLTKHNGGSVTDQNVLGEYSLVSGSFNSGESWFSGRVGHGYDTSDTTTSNYYSGSSSTNAVFQYDVSFGDIPVGATIKSLYMMANGHAESTSNSSEYMCVQLKSGSTALTEQFNFKSAGTSNTTQTIDATTIPTAAQLENLVVECTLGYYGGAINGVTVFLEYEVSGVWYTYSTTISGDMTVVVTIGGSGSPKIYKKVNGSWTEVSYSKVYKKVGGSWTEVTADTAFDTNTNYVWN